MKELNLNVENWSLVDSHESSESLFNISDVISLTDSISWANTDDLCDINMHEYTH